MSRRYEATEFTGLVRCAECSEPDAASVLVSSDRHGIETHDRWHVERDAQADPAQPALFA